MSLVCFGQPADGIIQMAYVVKDIQQSMREWAAKLKVGPWFLLPHFTGEDARYRGKPSTAGVSLAMSFAGHMMIELIQPLTDAPSVYRDVIDQRGYGFHHWGVATSNFDRDVKQYESEGCELAFFARVPSGGRVAYMDTTARLPGMTELIELGASFDPIFSRMYRDSIGWDGADPVRSFL
jgi:Glyoxalase/Bleomycin resistance protein/Dioxygenase superfamily